MQKMLEFLPSTVNAYEESVSYFGEVLETIIIEDIFMPQIIKLLKSGENIELISNIFRYFEEVSNCGDDYLIDLFSVTVLEKLGECSNSLNIAQRYVGPETNKLLIETIRDIYGR